MQRLYDTFTTMPLPLIERAIAHGERLALIDEAGAYTYAQVLVASHRVASCLLGEGADLQEARVAFMAPPVA